MIPTELKVKVFKLEKAPIPISRDYSKDIEAIINNNPEIKDKDGSYLLSDFKIINVEEKPYVVLRYEREM